MRVLETESMNSLHMVEPALLLCTSIAKNDGEFYVQDRTQETDNEPLKIYVMIVGL